MSTSTNWSPSGLPSTSAGDIMLFNGTSSFNTIPFNGGTFSGSDGIGGLSIASAQTNALAIANAGAANSVFRLRANANVTIGAGAGAFSFGTTGNSIVLNLSNAAIRANSARSVSVMIKR
jgi:hypothetical protein